MNVHLRKFRLFRFLIGSYFLKEKHTFQLRVFSGIQLIPYVKSPYQYLCGIKFFISGNFPLFQRH